MQTPFSRYVWALLWALLPGLAAAYDLPEVRQSGVLRHLGVPYAHFVTGGGDGLDVELMQGFAASLGVRYEYVATDWNSVFGDLTGRNARLGEHGAEWLDTVPVKGDVIAQGLTILPWRAELVAFSTPTFPTAVWLVARADSPITPIVPSGAYAEDIALVKRAMAGLSVLGLENTCLDPALYDLAATEAEVRLPEKHLQPGELAPAILNFDADTTLLDVPDALLALEQWPGRFKVIGPVSEPQSMAAAFRKDAPQLLAAFNAYYAALRQSGQYRRLVEKYYPTAFVYYADFFAEE